MYSSQIKKQFPIYGRYPDLIYWDNAATTQKPFHVIESIQKYYEAHHANISRGLYELSANTTKQYERIREEVGKLIGAKSHEVSFTYGTTDGINKIARSYVLPRLNEKKNIVITQLEHHANFLPWQLLCRQTGAELRICRVTSDGLIDYAYLANIVDSHTVIVAFSHISNVLGILNNVERVVNIASKNDVPILLDAAQSVATHPINVKELNVDFLVFSGHKMFGPTGIGVAYVKQKYHRHMEPAFVGGGMVEYVSNQETQYLDFPVLFEPGTPNIAGVFGLGAAIEFIRDNALYSRYKDVVAYSQRVLDVLKTYDVRIMGGDMPRHGIISFYHTRIHPHDIAQFLADNNIAVRAGHHCAQPLHHAYEINASVRVSFSVYNQENEVDKFIYVMDQCFQYFLK